MLSDSTLAIPPCAFSYCQMPAGMQYTASKFTAVCAPSIHCTSYFQNSHFLLKVLPTFLNILTSLQDKDLVNVYSSDNTNFRHLLLAAS